MLSLSLVKCCDKSAKCYGHLGGDGGAHTHTFVWICFLLSKQFKSRDRLTYVSTLCAEAGGGGVSIMASMQVRTQLTAIAYFVIFTGPPDYFFPGTLSTTSFTYAYLPKVVVTLL